MNIFLIGMRGVGKTTLGKLLAEKLGRKFVDMDEELERKFSRPIAEVVKEKGWEYFRAEEKIVLEEVTKKQNQVVSTGGGVLMFFDNANLIKKSGRVILLTASIKTLKERMIKSGHRPALLGNDALEELESVWETRRDSYHASADIVVNTEEQTVDEIAESLSRKFLEE